MRSTILFLSLLTVFAAVTDAAEASDTLARIAEEKRPESALRQVDDFLKARPNDFDGLLLRGYILSQLGDTTAAESVYRRLIRQYPDHPEPYNNLAVLYADAGNFQQAEETLKQALGTHPSYNVAYENLGRIYGRFASEAYSQALGVEAPPPSESETLVLLKRSPTESSAANPEVASDRTPSQPPPTARAGAARSQTDAAGPGPSVPQRQASVRPSSSNPPTQPPRPVATRPPTALQNSPPPTPTAKLQDELSLAVRSWARAWSEQRVEDYLGFYSDGFRPPDGLDRQTWASQRRQRIEGPRFIRVVVRKLRPPQTTPRGTAMTFVQSYSSDHFADKVTKTLIFVREDDAWRIIEERKGS